eukprot:10971547-Alexandrium_andersonii.AAC.1
MANVGADDCPMVSRVCVQDGVLILSGLVNMSFDHLHQALSSWENGDIQYYLPSVGALTDSESGPVTALVRAGALWGTHVFHRSASVEEDVSLG